MNLALRFDGGRRESESDQLLGMGDIPATVRARLNLRWEPAPYWAVNLGSSFDALNRVGGYVVNGSVSRTVLLGGIRSVMLWRQLGGSRLDFVFKRKPIYNATIALLENPPL